MPSFSFPVPASSPYVCCVGAVGWDHPAWAGGFYPADLPEEWRLAYYSQFHRCAWLPRDLWLPRSPEELAAWAESVREGFRFVAEAPETGDMGAAARLAALGTRLGRVAAHDEVVWVAGEPDLAVLAAHIRACPPGAPTLYLIVADGSRATLERLESLLEVLGV